MSKHDDDGLAADLLHGAEEIGKFLGIDQRKIYYHIAKGHLPVTKIGALIVASRSVLRRHFTEKSAA